MPWWTAPPVIVAEALTAVPDPLVTALRPGPSASGAAVAASIALSLVPAEDGSPAPAWLLESQQLSFRRVLAALGRYGGAVLADPVGSGKTYIALAAAATLNRGAITACLVPATLIPQWQAAASALGIPIALYSHQQASRGRLPTTTRGLVIVDESHHFRNRLTKRYAHAAAWLLSRPVLLVTATPIVNRLSDLGNQLLLAVRDNALAVDGIPSLWALFDSGGGHAAVGQLIVENDGAANARPRRIARLSAPTAEECGAFGVAAELIGRLRLSRSGAIAALIRGALLKAAGSSPAALVGALRRYRALLLHARDALQAGRALDRSELRRFTRELGDQLVWWELVAHDTGSSDLELADLGVLNEVIPAALVATAHQDGKLCRLAEILRQDQPTLVFTCSRDTVRYIRERLEPFSLAWCTGDRAGIGSTPLPRSTVLGWFREGITPSRGPRHLVVTDVAAEGLDLQRTARVVHYDLPWTPMRLEQRDGRSVRLGSRHPEVEVVRFVPPPALEQLIRVEAILSRKAILPGHIGIGPRGRHLWRWRSDVGQKLGDGGAVAGVAGVRSIHQGLLAGVALYHLRDSATCLSSTVIWLEMNGEMTEAREIVTDRLLAAARQSCQQVVQTDRLRAHLELLTPHIRSRLTLIRGSRWLASNRTAAARVIAARLGQLIRDAARLRQECRLSELERALAFVAGGHTAGEEMLLERLAEASDRDLTARLSRVLPEPDWDDIEVRLTGLIVFGPQE